MTLANLVKKCPDTDELPEGLKVGPSLYYNWRTLVFPKVFLTNSNMFALFFVDHCIFARS